MSRRAQASGNESANVLQARFPKVVAVLVAALPLAACASGFDLGKAEVDSSLYTSAVSTDSGAASDPSQLSDATTIRNAVSSADIGETGGQPLAWANSVTGSRGAITDVREYQDKGSLCRRFQASRESFDGVAMYSGDACLADGGAWRMRAFEALSR